MKVSIIIPVRNEEILIKKIIAELESKVKEIDFSNPNTVLQLAKNWAESEKKRLDAENKVKILQHVHK